MLYQPKTMLQIGFSQNTEYACSVYILEQKIHTIWQKNDGSANHFLSLQAVKKQQKFTIIRPASASFVWRKYLFLPNNLSHSQLYRQLIQVIQQELPIPLEDIYFDYQHQAVDEQTLRVILYAIKRDYADKLLTPHDTIIDCELNCFVRGFAHLFPKPLADLPFLIQGKYVHFTEKALQISTQAPEEFYHLGQLEFSDDILSPELYITALGACLWNGKASI